MNLPMNFQGNLGETKIKEQIWFLGDMKFSGRGSEGWLLRGNIFWSFIRKGIMIQIFLFLNQTGVRLWGVVVLLLVEEASLDDRRILYMSLIVFFLLGGVLHGYIFDHAFFLELKWFKKILVFIVIWHWGVCAFTVIFVNQFEVFSYLFFVIS